MSESGVSSPGPAAPSPPSVRIHLVSVHCIAVTDTGFTAALGTVYCFSKDATANLREKDDTFNTTVASFLGGATLGLKSIIYLDLGV